MWATWQFAYAENVIADVEFALLFDYNRSKLIFPFWKLKMKSLIWKLGMTSRGVSHGVTFWQKWFTMVDEMFTNPQASSLPARYRFQWNGGIIYPFEEMAYPWRCTCRYGTYVRKKSVWVVSFSTKWWTLSTRLTTIVLKVGTRFFFPQTNFTTMPPCGTATWCSSGFVDGTVNTIARPKYNQL